MEYKDKKYTYLGGLVHGISTLATGMKTSIKVYFRKKVTEQYPENRKAYVTAKNAAKIGISAQVRAAGFYETLGFVRQGEEYLEENCPHIYMEKTL